MIEREHSCECSLLFLLRIIAEQVGESVSPSDRIGYIRAHTRIYIRRFTRTNYKSISRHHLLNKWPPPHERKHNNKLLSPTETARRRCPSSRCPSAPRNASLPAGACPGGDCFIKASRRLTPTRSSVSCRGSRQRPSDIRGARVYEKGLHLKSLSGEP